LGRSAYSNPVWYSVWYRIPQYLPTTQLSARMMLFPSIDPRAAVNRKTEEEETALCFKKR
jgi:hypothetical protein